MQELVPEPGQRPAPGRVQQRALAWERPERRRRQLVQGRIPLPPAEAGEELLGQHPLLRLQARQQRGEQEEWAWTCWLLMSEPSVKYKESEIESSRVNQNDERGQNGRAMDVLQRAHGAPLHSYFGVGETSPPHLKKPIGKSISKPNMPS